MWIITLLIVTAILFIFRGMRVLNWYSFGRYLLAAFALWAAMVLSPEPVPLKAIEALGYILAIVLAGGMLIDILVEVFYRIKAAIFAGDRFTKVLPDYLSEICDAMETMASRKIGALVVVQRQDSIDEHVQGGMPYDSEVNAKLLPTIFAVTSPVHDGAVVIREGRIVRVKTVLPIKTSAPISLGVGTRHRAAVGLTEKTDALVIVASEERGEISIAFKGQLVKPASPDEFRSLILAAIKGKDIAVVQEQLAKEADNEE